MLLGLHRKHAGRRGRLMADEVRDATQALGGSSFAGRLKVVLLVSSADTNQVYDTLDTYMDPLGTTSIEAAVDGDNT